MEISLNILWLHNHHSYSAKKQRILTYYVINYYYYKVLLKWIMKQHYFRRILISYFSAHSSVNNQQRPAETNIRYLIDIWQIDIIMVLMSSITMSLTTLDDLPQRSQNQHSDRLDSLRITDVSRGYVSFVSLWVRVSVILRSCKN
jgi:hypothetical protein